MTVTHREWMLGLAAAFLAGNFLATSSPSSKLTNELKCSRLTVVDSQGRPRIVLEGSPPASGNLISVLDVAGTPRITLAVEQRPDDELVDSSARIEILDHLGLHTAELVEEGNHQHGTSSSLNFYGRDLQGKPESIAMLGTDTFAGWPHLEFSPQGGGFISLGLGDFGAPGLTMIQSKHKQGAEPGTVEERAKVGRFTIQPGDRNGMIRVGREHEVVSRLLVK